MQIRRILRNSEIYLLKMLLKTYIFSRNTYRNISSKLSTIYCDLMLSDILCKSNLLVALLFVFLASITISSETMKADIRQCETNYRNCVEALEDYQKAVYDYYDLVEELNKIYGHSTAKQYTEVHNQKPILFQNIRIYRNKALKLKEKKMLDGEKVEIDNWFNRIDIEDNNLNKELEIHD